ncbi:MAG: hypothetical protein AB1716_01560 [Planctomycetota bacterium]
MPRRDAVVSKDRIPVAPARRAAAPLLLLALALLVATGGAVRSIWLCDDAFISYRYADNLVRGLGLVYNAGERVEGYTNFLWTVWCALGLALGTSCERWSIVWGLACYLGSVALLGYYSLRVLRAAAPAVAALPIAAVLAALHADWHVYATSGLETSAFTLAALGGYVLLVRHPHVAPSRAAIAGLVFAATGLLRPDGVIFSALGGLYVLWRGRPRLWSIVAYGLAVGLPSAAFLAWRYSYYGDIVPNTYYAKSAGLAWWDQGWHYTVLYFQKYAVLLVGMVGLAWILLRRSRDRARRVWEPEIRRHALLAALFAAAYTLYIMRVGGDFMYARMLIPATPFYLILVELALLHVFPVARQHGSADASPPLTRRQRSDGSAEASPSLARAGAAAGLAALLVVWPRPALDNPTKTYGVVDERGVYKNGRVDLVDPAEDRLAIALRRFCDGLTMPVRIAFVGTQAHVAYRSRVPVAIEAHAGLTDREIARQPLTERGRVGHEKSANIEYLLRRRVHFVFHAAAPDLVNGMRTAVPAWLIQLGDEKGYVVHWDPPLMAELGRRGALFNDAPAELDRLMQRLDGNPNAPAVELYARFRAFYFDHVSDPVRYAAFRSRVARVRTPLP